MYKIVKNVNIVMEITKDRDKQSIMLFTLDEFLHILGDAEAGIAFEQAAVRILIYVIE